MLSLSPFSLRISLVRPHDTKPLLARTHVLPHSHPLHLGYRLTTIEPRPQSRDGGIALIHKPTPRSGIELIKPSCACRAEQSSRPPSSQSLHHVVTAARYAEEVLVLVYLSTSLTHPCCFRSPPSLSLFAAFVCCVFSISEQSYHRSRSPTRWSRRGWWVWTAKAGVCCERREARRCGMRDAGCGLVSVCVVAERVCVA
jgi:hypothetical protein